MIAGSVFVDNGFSPVNDVVVGAREKTVTKMDTPENYSAGGNCFVT